MKYIALLIYTSVFAVQIWGVMCQFVKCGKRNKNCLVGEICINRICRRLCANGGACPKDYVCGKSTRSNNEGVEICCEKGVAFSIKKNQFCFKASNGDACRADQECKSDFCKRGKCKTKPPSYSFRGTGFCVTEQYQYLIGFCGGEIDATTCAEVAKTYKADAYSINNANAPAKTRDACFLWNRKFVNGACPPNFQGNSPLSYPTYFPPTQAYTFDVPSYSILDCFIKD